MGELVRKSRERQLEVADQLGYQIREALRLFVHELNGVDANLGGELLKGCSEEQLLKVFNGINRAVKLGAPLYNDGDHETCYGIYRQTASHFEKDKDMCKGMRDAFGTGLLKAETKPDFTAKAWTMRDTFDGLLNVLVRLAQELGPRP